MRLQRTRPQTDENRDVLARLWVPFVILLTILASSLPTPVNFLYIPDFLLMVVYLAAAFRSEVFPVWLCFTAGLLADLLGGSPPGLQAALFIAVHAFAVSQRVHLNAVLFLWGGFVLVALTGAAFRWAVLSASAGYWLSSEPFFVNAIITLIVFPVISHPLQGLIGGIQDGARRT